MQKKTYYHIILDQSSSMGDCIEPTISGFNEQIQVIQSLKHRFPEQDIQVGLTRFNDNVMPTFYAQPPHSVNPLTRELYTPGGTTALFDAIGITVSAIKENLGDELVQGNTTVIVVILTDGHENASRLFNLSGIRKLIRQLEATGKWTFTYLGATIDAVEVAEHLNIKKQNSMSFEKGQMASCYQLLNHSLNSYMKDRREGKYPGDFLRKDMK